VTHRVAPSNSPSRIGRFLLRSTRYEPGGRRFESCWARQVLHLSILASAGVPSERLVKTRRSQLRILLASHLISFTHYALRPPPRWVLLGPIGGLGSNNEMKTHRGRRVHRTCIVPDWVCGSGRASADRSGRPISAANPQASR